MQTIPGQTILPGHLAPSQRPVLRAVALAYRRAKREGLHEHDAYKAALAEYLRLASDAPVDHLEASHRVMVMICAAINADRQWFWHGPDA